MFKELIPFGRKNVPVRVESNNPFEQLHKRMNELFESFFEESASLLPSLSGDGSIFNSINADFDVLENDKEIIVKADLPGMDENDIQVSLENGLLTISGEKIEEKNESENTKAHLTERSYGMFSRSFHIPVEIDEKKVKASFKKGVLTINLPKLAEKKKKGISVKVEQG